VVHPLRGAGVRVYNRFIVALALCFTLTTVVLSLGNERRLDLYFSLYLIEYLILSLLFVSFNPKGKRLVGILGYILFPGFMAIVALKVAHILWGFSL